MLALLLRNKLRMYANLIRRADRSRRLRILLLIALWMGFVYYLFQGAHALFSAIVLGAGTQVATRVLAAVLLALLVALLLSGATICIHTLFISHDLPLLLSVPIPRRTVFMYKLLEATLSNSSMFVMLGLPVLLGFGAAHKAAWWWYLPMLIVATVFVGVPTSLSAMVALAAVHVVPVRRAREVMSVALALVFLAVWSGMQLLRSSLDAGRLGGIEELLAIARLQLFGLTPAGWAAQTMAGMLRADWASAATFATLLVTSTTGMILLSVWLVDSVYARGVGKEEAATLGSPAPDRRARPMSSGVAASPVRAAMARDIRLLRRDPTQLMQLIMLAAMMAVMAIILKRDTEGEELSRFETLMPFAFVALFAAMSTVGIAARLIPLEGKAFYLNKLAPEPAVNFLAAKLLVGWLLGTVVSLFGAIVVTVIFGHPLSVGAVGFATASVGCMAMSGVGTALGAYFADFDWETPKRMITVGGGVLSAVLPLLCLGALAGMGFATYLVLGAVTGVRQSVAVAGGSLVVLATSMAIAVGSLLLASRRIETMGWTY
ncbi:MAG: hypothetical protein ONB07_01060 [candidate division KSB1 bacterium]|nr:hypothetical protein [candidate division KSB1 bacterium]